jgi:aldehyde:ferredoxin oxidoreductase
LPERITGEKRKTGGAPDYLPNLGKMLSEYYSVRNWDENGIPLQSTIEKLGLREEANNLLGPAVTPLGESG